MALEHSSSTPPHHAIDFETVGSSYFQERELKKGAAGWVLLVGLGVDELSVTARSMALVKARVRELDSRQARTLADRALTLDSASAVRALVAEMH